MATVKDVKWQLRTWFKLAASVTAYPALSREQRKTLVEGHEWARHRLLPSRRLDVLAAGLPDETPLHLERLETRQFNASIFEIVTLGVVSRVVRPRRCFEIGTFDGRSALAIAVNAPDAEVFTLNLPADFAPAHDDAVAHDVALYSGHASGQRFAHHEASARITQLFGDSRTFDFAPYAPSQLVFVDGAHHLDAVERDTRNALAMVDRSNGAVIWHDATSYDVPKVLRRLLADGMPLRRIDGTDIAILRWSGGQPVYF